MKTGQSWKCAAEGCEDTKLYNYRGLCRSCTEYSEDKSVAVAVNRVKVFESGEVMPTLGNTLAHRLTRQDFLNHRRSKRLTKKQLVALEAAHKHTQAGYGQEPDEHIHTEDCEHNHAEITEIGESIEEEE